jgi:hypothetical protein
MSLGLVECLLDNYLFTLSNIITLSTAFHVPSSVDILLHCHSRWSLRSWLFLHRSLDLNYSWFFELFKVKVKIMLRLTVSQSVCLSVEPRLGLMTRCYSFK